MIKLQKIDTVLFDLDGTLVDSNELIIKSFERTLKEFLPERDFLREEIIEMIGPPLKETFKIKSDDPIIIEKMINYYRKVYVEMEFDYIELYPNVIQTLKTLYDNGINLGIVTTKFKESAIPSIEHYGLDKYIKSYCFLDDVSEHKPHPEPIFYALNQFDSYKGVIMVGDNSSDIMAGRNATCLTCGVEWSIKKEVIKELNPDFWLTDYLELIDIVLNNNRRK